MCKNILGVKWEWKNKLSNGCKSNFGFKCV